MKSQRPELLVGWDCPGEEDLGRPTLDYAKQLLAPLRAHRIRPSDMFCILFCHRNIVIDLETRLIIENI